MQDRLLTPSEAAAYLGIGVDALRKDRRRPEPRIPCRRTPGGHHRYSLKALERIVTAGKAGSDREWASGQALLRKVAHETEARIVAARKLREAAEALDCAGLL